MRIHTSIHTQTNTYSPHRPGTRAPCAVGGSTENQSAIYTNERTYFHHTINADMCIHDRKITQSTLYIPTSPRSGWWGQQADRVVLSPHSSELPVQPSPSRPWGAAVVMRCVCGYAGVWCEYYSKERRARWARNTDTQHTNKTNEHKAHTRAVRSAKNDVTAAGVLAILSSISNSANVEQPIN